MPDNSLSGKLAVILHADVVGSTALVQQDEQKSHARIQESFRRFGKTIVTYHGQVSELRGDALESLTRARKINPRNTGVYLEIEGRSLFLLGRFDEALQVLEAAVQKNPAVDRIHLLLAATYAELGRLEDAAWSIDEALSINPEISLANERQEAIYLRESDLDLYVGALRKAGLS